MEHDQSYQKQTQANIEVNHINTISIVEHCPIIEYTNFEHPVKWYDISNLVFEKKIDFIVVDGPPGALKPQARYPAIPLLHHFFSDNVVIVLDDANRRDETITVEKWIRFLEAHKFTLEVITFNNFEKGLVILNAHKKCEIVS